MSTIFPRLGIYGWKEADGPLAWAEVECEDRGASWQDVWALTDMAEVTAEHGKDAER